MGERETGATLPAFRMPTCWRHFFKGNRWWCRACSREVERQFKDVCEAYWSLKNGSEPQP